jgi:glycosyltransferase involved in cell wall biosynthesis
MISEDRPPLISVILPVYNGAKTVMHAVESILAQTYENFEFIIIDDGSIDETNNILASFKDKRIRLINNQKNMGKVHTLNTGIQKAQGQYIAFIDADDVALPARLEKQVNFLAKNPSIAVLGTATKEIYPGGMERIRYRPRDTSAIKKNIVRICPFTHSSTMIRSEVFNTVGLYDPLKDGPKRLYIGEDYDLWVRILAAGYNMANIPDVLTVYYREPGSSIRGRSLSQLIKQRISARIDVINKLNLGYSAYFNIIPVVVLSILNHYGIQIDSAFNLLSGVQDSRSE